MKIEIVETFIGFPDGVTKPERTFVVGAVVDVDAGFGKAMIEKGHAKFVADAEPPAKKEKLHETE